MCSETSCSGVECNVLTNGIIIAEAELLLEIESHSYQVQEDIAALSASLTRTLKNYAPHLKRYESFCSNYRTPTRPDQPTPIDPFPITPAKATLFLKHEMTRPQQKSGRGGESGEFIEGTTVGRSHMQQVSISI